MNTNDSHLTSSYVTTIDAGIEEASEALMAINPMSSLATRLSALGLDDRAVWAESSEAAALTDRDNARNHGFGLLWRFGPPNQTAMIGWRAQLSRDGVGRTLLSITIRAKPSDDEAGKRTLASWPIIETIMLTHAKSLRRAVDEYTADPCDADRSDRSRRAVLSAAA